MRRGRGEEALYLHSPPHTGGDGLSDLKPRGYSWGGEGSKGMSKARSTEATSSPTKASKVMVTALGESSVVIFQTVV